MPEDNIYILLGAILLIVLMVVSSKYNKTFFWCNFSILICYLLFFKYKMRFDSAYGGALGWLFFLWISWLIQLFIVVGFLIFRIKRKT
jgi:hypothetical protein